ncbi:hypothetical protein ACFCYB_13365 [Streptomyces sp. NPDC056309]|uniref:hypothetical protein n=1 Tax=unclassified Streptomyces TaxID=2593676 RepID=UPI0035DD317E
MTSTWTNEAAIRQWNASTTRETMEATAAGGDFAKRHLLNGRWRRSVASWIRAVEHGLNRTA